MASNVANAGLGVSDGLGLAHGMARAVDHGSQDHVVDRRDVVDRPADAHLQQLAAKLGMEIRLGKPLANLADQFRRLPEGFQPEEMVGDLPGFVGRRMRAQRLDLLRKLIDLALELRFQTGIAHPGGHGQVVSQRDPQIGKPLQFQPFIARRQLVVDSLRTASSGLAFCNSTLNGSQARYSFQPSAESPARHKR